jgi:hypothetical protein
MLQDFVLPSFLTAPGRAMAGAFLAEAQAMLAMDDLMEGHQ